MVKAKPIENNPFFNFPEIGDVICTSSGIKDKVVSLEHKTRGTIGSVMMSDEKFSLDNKLNPSYFTYINNYKDCVHVVECYDADTIERYFRHRVFNNDGQQLLNVEDSEFKVHEEALFVHYSVTPCEEGIFICKAKKDNLGEDPTFEQSAVDYNGNAIDLPPWDCEPTDPPTEASEDSEQNPT